MRSGWIESRGLLENFVPMARGSCRSGTPRSTSSALRACGRSSGPPTAPPPNHGDKVFEKSSNRRSYEPFAFLGALLLVFGLSCITTTQTNTPPPTLQTFEGNYEVIWAAAFDVIYTQKKLPIKMINKEIGFLASDWITEERTLFDKENKQYMLYPSRYRVNLSFRRAPADHLPPGFERITITVNKQMQLQSNNQWRPFLSDHQMEAAILVAIQNELNQ